MEDYTEEGLKVLKKEELIAICLTSQAKEQAATANAESAFAKSRELQAQVSKFVEKTNTDMNEIDLATTAYTKYIKRITKG